MVQNFTQNFARISPEIFPNFRGFFPGESARLARTEIFPDCAACRGRFPLCSRLFAALSLEDLYYTFLPFSASRNTQLHAADDKREGGLHVCAVEGHHRDTVRRVWQSNPYQQVRPSLPSEFLHRASRKFPRTRYRGKPTKFAGKQSVFWLPGRGATPKLLRFWPAGLRRLPTVFPRVFPRFLEI